MEWMSKNRCRVNDPCIGFGFGFVFMLYNTSFCFQSFSLYFNSAFTISDLSLLFLLNLIVSSLSCSLHFPAVFCAIWIFRKTFTDWLQWRVSRKIGWWWWLRRHQPTLLLSSIGGKETKPWSYRLTIVSVSLSILLTSAPPPLLLLVPLSSRIACGSMAR